MSDPYVAYVAYQKNLLDLVDHIRGTLDDGEDLMAILKTLEKGEWPKDSMTCVDLIDATIEHYGKPESNYNYVTLSKLNNLKAALSQANILTIDELTEYITRR